MAQIVNKPLYILNVEIGYSENRHIYTHPYIYIQSDEIVNQASLH